MAGEGLHVVVDETRLVVRGELDATTMAVFDRALASLDGPVLVDLTGVSFIDSKALAVVVQAMQTQPCPERRRM
jgi:anti-anti-sigma factor